MGLYIHLVRDAKLAVDMVQQDILSSFHQNYPDKVALSPRMVLGGTEMHRLKVST